MGLYITEENFNIEQNAIEISLYSTGLNSPIESLYLCYFIFELGFRYQLENLVDIEISPTDIEVDNVFIGIRSVSSEDQSNGGLLKSRFGLK